MTGKLICIEGIDASGKNTQAKLLAERLKGKVFSYPNYETASGKAILEHLQSKWKCIHREVDNDISEGININEGLSQWDPMVLQSLYVINRLERDAEVRSLLANNVNVIFDRYYVSGMVYGSLDGLDIDWVELLHSTMTKPDLNILIDVSLEESIKRRPERRDRYEENHDLMFNARLAYLSIFHSKASEHKGWQIIDGVGSVGEVHEQVWNTVKDFYLEAL